jgi:hypothetical protein
LRKEYPKHTIPKIPDQAFMKVLLSFLLLSFVLAVGCRHAPPPLPKPERFRDSGSFELTNNAGVKMGTVIWVSQQDTKTNDIQFVLILPVTTEVTSGGGSWGNVYYAYWDAKLKSNGHLWKIETRKATNARLHWLQVFNYANQTATVVQLQLGRYWQVSDDGTLVRLDAVDEAITQKVLHEGEVLLKETMSTPAFKGARAD